MLGLYSKYFPGNTGNTSRTAISQVRCRNAAQASCSETHFGCARQIELAHQLCPAAHFSITIPELAINMPMTSSGFRTGCPDCIASLLRTVEVSQF